MTMQPSPDVLDLAETVAAGVLRADEAERQLRVALGPDHGAESENAVRELHGLIGAADAVRSHARATREALGATSPDLAPTVAPTLAPIATLVRARVTAGAVHRHSPNGRDGAGRAPRRTWLLVAATLAVGTGIVSASLIGGRLLTPSPQPSLPVAVVNPSAVPTVAPSPSVVHSASGLIAFTDHYGGFGPKVWIANADGTGKHELAPGGCQGWPSWSPDGSRLLVSRIDPPGPNSSDADPCGFFVNLGDAGTRLYLTDASGSAPQLVDTGCVDPCISDSRGVFSSDGRRIFFTRLINVDDPSATGIAGKPAPMMQVGLLATMDLATGRVTELPDFPAGSATPAWSSDRTQILFDRLLPPPPSSSEWDPGSNEVFVADADGRNAHRVSPSGGDMNFAAWSPDGTLIVFSRHQYTWVGNEITAVSVDIFTVRPDGTDLRRLTTDEISVIPRWSVDGRIWFVREPGMNGDPQTIGPPAQYWIMDADGGNATQSSLGPQPHELADTAWQPTP